MITLLTISFLLLIAVGSIALMYNGKSQKKGNAETWEKLMMSRLDK